MAYIAEHSLRHRLNKEFHARPPLPLLGTVLTTHIAVLHNGSSVKAETDHLACLVDVLPGAFAEKSEAYHLYDGGNYRLRWELHTEFSSYTVYQRLASGIGINRHLSALDAFPSDWLSGIPGELLVGMHVELRSKDEISPDALAASLSPGDKQIVVSKIIDGAAWAFSDFLFEDSIDRQNFTRFLIVNLGLTQRQAGRTVQRLCEIETYRMMALLGLPVAKEIGGWLRGAEEELAALTERIGKASAHEDERNILGSLLALAAKVEHSVARTNFRFAAARAYNALVAQRIEELRETRVQGFPTFHEFMDRRLVPPMETCVAMARRQEELSERLSRNGLLLRTRVDVELERQNQELLAQMNHRAKMQLRLQETVEGLSVVAITYYGSQLVLHLAEGLEPYLRLPPARVVAAVSIPLIALAVVLSLRRLRRALSKAVDTESVG